MELVPPEPDVPTPPANVPALRDRAKEEFVMTAAASIGGQVGPMLKWVVVVFVAQLTGLAGVGWSLLERAVS